ncbi:MAG: hypothetical protein M1820_005681 [Bogoriella megaspora]|nr:MAG: hypothetical protein M1820_005681 [Bogoriella megaspora]
MTAQCLLFQEQGGSENSTDPSEGGFVLSMMVSDLEKTDFEIGQVENAGVNKTGSNTSSEDVGAPLGFTPAEQKAIIRRIDYRLVTTVGCMYCVSLMDRTNLGNANIAGMKKDLELAVGFRYSIATLVFFIPYVLFQPPSTVIVRKLGPRIHLAGITVLWGAMMIAMGFSNSWQTLAGLRVILGTLEAGFFPSCVYLLSTYYVRYDVGKRYSIFYLLGCVASAFAGILAFGLMQMDGLAGRAGWRWIFIMEGLITCLLGIAGYWLLVGFPDDTRKSWRWLNERELEFVRRKVDADRGDAHTEPFGLRKFLVAGLDLKIWGFALIFFCLTTVSYALAYFLPIILTEEMGFTVGASQCLIAPPYAFAGILMFSTAWWGDRYRMRGPVLVFNAVITIIGLSLMGFAEQVAVRYFGVFLTAAGANANIPACMAYQANNIRGQWKRAFCSATLVGMGGVGGIAGSLVFRTQDSPTYHPGLWACIAASLLIIVIVCGLSVRFWYDNRKQAQGKLAIEGSESGFRYTY